MICTARNCRVTGDGARLKKNSPGEKQQGRRDNDGLAGKAEKSHP